MKKKVLFAGFLILLVQIGVVAACGGRDIVLSDNPQQSGATSKYVQKYGENFYFDSEGNLLLNKDKIQVSKETADEIIWGYLDTNYPGWEEFHFESLDLEHGSPVYMYGSHAPGIALTYHVGAVQFVTDHLHLHVDAITGDLLDVGCGGGPSKVLSTTQTSAGPNEWDKILPEGKTYFYAEYVIPEGKEPTIDGKIGSREWKDAESEHIHFGSAEEEIISYGCGGSGKEVSNRLNVAQELDVRSKIVGDNIYFAVRSESPNWIGLMLKDFAHHGMIGDFGDVKILSSSGIYDYYLSSNQFSDAPVAKDKGTRGCFHYGKLVPDEQNNMWGASGFNDGYYEYEFSFPLNNADPADTHWKENEAYQIAFLIGDSENFNGLTKTTFMSNQETIRLVNQLDYESSVENPNAVHDDDHNHDHDEHEHEESGLVTGLVARVMKLFN